MCLDTHAFPEKKKSTIWVQHKSPISKPSIPCRTSSPTRRRSPLQTTLPFSPPYRCPVMTPSGPFCRLPPHELVTLNLTLRRKSTCRSRRRPGWKAAAPAQCCPGRCGGRSVGGRSRLTQPAIDDDPAKTSGEALIRWVYRSGYKEWNYFWVNFVWVRNESGQENILVLILGVFITEKEDFSSLGKLRAYARWPLYQNHVRSGWRFKVWMFVCLFIEVLGRSDY